jgi:DNA-binding beta-propeller fold protein YncE
MKVEEIPLARSSRRRGPGSGLLLAMGLLLGAAAQSSAQEVVLNRPLAAEDFATLPPDANFPEGIAANPANGEIYVGTFDAPPTGNGTNFLVRFDRRGRVLAQLPVGPVPITGLAFNRRDNQVYLCRPGALLGQGSRIQRLPAAFTASTPVEDVAQIPDLPSPGSRTETTLDQKIISITLPDSVAAPNGLAFQESDGTLFVTDSLQAAVFRIADPSRPSNICPNDASCTQTLIQDPLLASAAFPQLGVNGIAASADEKALFLTNTGDDRLLSFALADRKLTVVADSLEGADGIVRGIDGTLIVSRALGDELTLVDATTGRILAEFGEFRGVRRDGSPRGLLFPGSIVRVGDTVFANNLALPLSGSPSEPELDIKVYTISRVQVPRVPSR